MCQTISGVAVRVDESSVRVYTSPDSDSHTSIRVLHNINDTSKMSRYQPPVELVPIGDVDLFDTARWTFEFDDERPDWWTEDMTMQARKQLDTAWQARWSSSGLMFKGDLYLSSLTSLPENAPNCRGYRCADGVRRIGKRGE